MQHMRPAKLVASYDMKKIVSLLYEYGVDVSQYAVKHPEILQCQGKQGCVGTGSTTSLAMRIVFRATYKL